MSAGGIWTASNSFATIDSSTGMLSGNSTGIDTVTYTLPTGCSTAATITVNPMPAAIGGSATVCVGATDTLTDATLGGTWTANNGNLSIGIGTGIAAGVLPGTDTVTYSLPTGCHTVQTISVNALPTSGMVMGKDSLCAGTTDTLTDPIAGGDWSISGTGAIIGTNGVVTGIAPGVYAVTYTVTNGCGMAAVQHNLNVLPQPYASAITGSGMVCAAMPSIYTDTTIGGVWSVADTNVALISASGILSGKTSGLDTVFYTVTNNCGTAAVSLVVAVDTMLHAEASGISYVCAGKHDTLSGLPAGGTWSVSNGNASLLGNVLSGVTSGSIDTVSYSVTNVCGTSTSEVVVVIPTEHVCDSIDAVPAVASGDDEFDMYPNPGYGQFHVALPSDIIGKSITLTVTDVSGREVFVAKGIAHPIETVEINAQPGMYIVTLRYGNREWRNRVVVMAK